MVNTLRCFVFWSLCSSLASAQPQAAPQPDGLDRQIEIAFRTQNATLLDSLVNAHRLAIKPLVEGLLTQSMKSDPAGGSKDFQTMVAKARTISSCFNRVHGEKSLDLAVDDVRRWSGNERRVKLVADSLHALGTKLRAGGETRDQALALYRKSLKLYRTLNDRRGEGTTLGSLGFIYWYKNDPEQALRYFEEGLKLRSLVDDRQLMGNSYNDIGSVYYNFFKKYPLAIDYHRRAEEVRREIGDRSGLGRTLDNLALDYWDSGDLNEARRESEAAARAHAEAGDQERVARSLHNCGILLTDLGRYEEALLAHDRSIDIRQKLGDKGRIAEALDAKGVVYYRMGDYESAYGCYQQALSMMLEVGDDRGIAAASYKSGVVLSDLGKTERALQAYQTSLDIFRKAGDGQGALHALSNMGVAYIDMKQYPRAEELLKQALAMSRELPDHSVEIVVLTMIGNAQNFQGNLDSAVQNYREALAKAKLKDNPDLMWPPLLGLGDVEEKRCGYATAIGFYTHALECIDRIRGSLEGEEFKISFAEKKRYVSEAVIHLMTRLHEQEPDSGYDARSFRLAEGAKARAFLDLLSLSGIRRGADSLLLGREDSLLTCLIAARQQLDALSQDPRDNRDTIAALRSAIEGLERELRRVRNDLREKNPRYSALKYPEPIGIEDVQKELLDPNTVLLEYSVGDSSTSLWGITQQEKRLFRLPDRETLKNQVDLLRSEIALREHSSPEGFQSVARRLYRMLLGPAEEFISRGERLLIVPDGELSYLPFEVLLTGDVRGGYAELPYLLKRYSVVYVQSASVLRSLQEQKRAGAPAGQKELIAFGDPVFSDHETSDTTSEENAQPTDSLRGKPARLPNTGSEVREIVRLFPPGSADLFLRGDATEERVKQQGLLSHYRFIHFATHGLVNERKPELSALLFSRKEKSNEDGYLRSAEIFNLDLSSQLVVLSACQTGMGRLIRGEGLIGLTRAFMYAGTPSVVVSLWNVADVSTATLMQYFYERMIVRGDDKSEALRRAKLSLGRSGKFAHPFYWAPFVVVGDWRL